VIRKLLVANRGEIARRVFRTCRELGIATVAVHSPPDADALFVAEADEAVALGGPSPAESYLRADAIVAAALRSGADAVHPGYGFLSEDAGFAAAVLGARLTWVGPPPAVIAAMGSKLEARRLMADAGVPVLPGAALDGVEETGGELDALADRVGWPLLVKASAGGGGRGMRVVRRRDDLADAIASARREAAGAFGDGTVFLERYVDNPRHVEIQIFGDEQGTVVAMFERECSIQRRYQKILEEAPSPALTPALRRAMSEAAVSAGRAIGYVGAGTVEFVLAPGGDFAFLEVNTRLQVEHPVTEEVTGLDLVALQLAVAEGAPLPAAARAPELRGHAIEARLYAEDPLRSFLPSAGTLACLEIPAGGAVRVDSGYRSGDTVPVDYDPMLAKVVASGATREEARRRLIAALRRARIHGVRTNRDLLVAVLEHAEFAAGRIDTHFLERHPPTSLCPTPGASAAVVRHAAAAAALADQAVARRAASVWSEAPSGWRNNPGEPPVRRYAAGDSVVEVRYRHRDGRWWVEVDGLSDDLDLGRVAPDLVELVAGGVRRRLLVARAGERVWVDGPEGSVELGRVPRFPAREAHPATGSLLAPMPGLVRRIVVGEGQRVTAGAALVVLEAMKMEHTVTAPAAGTIRAVRVGENQTVDAGTALVVLDTGPAGPSGDRGNGTGAGEADSVGEERDG